MPRRLTISSRWGWAMLWVAVVVVTCTLTWATIMRVADDVATIGGPGLVAAPSRVAGAPVTEGATPPTTGPSGVSGQTSPVTAPPTPLPPLSSSASSPGTKLHPGQVPAPSPAPHPAVQRTLRTDGGTIVAACTGALLSVRSVTPADGWSVRQERDSDKTKVSFERGDQSREVEVECRAGTPTFDLE